jgi:hypothetical protein
MKTGFQAKVLFSSWNPIVLVLASEEVENACKKNGQVNFMSFLYPFSYLKENITYKLGKQVCISTFYFYFSILLFYFSILSF